MSEWLTGILDALGIRQTDLVGQSYGGFAALNYVMHAPDRLKKLILISPAGGLAPLKTQFYIRGMLTSLPGLSRVTMKSLLYWMFYKPNDPVAAAARTKQLIPDIQTELIPHASHDMPVSQPETVNHKVLKFLKEWVGRSGCAVSRPGA